MVVSYITVGIGVLAVAVALSISATAAGLGMGLFGVLSIIRLRSTELAQHEVAYFFAALALGLLGGIGASLATTALLMALVVVSLWIGDHPSLLRRNRHQVVMVDRAISDETALTDHLSRLLNARIHSIEVQRLDLVNDTTLVDVRYRLHRPLPQEETDAPALTSARSPESPDGTAELPAALSPADAWNPIMQEPPSHRPQREPRSAAAAPMAIR